ncbi:galactokinase [Nocardioides carbamazepini]|uniref:galactokinase n=1 Tax=Nocardioides carbamazepini TaxID=2854259 RepID=UPI00214A247E|nr:galactokinase family protein [Nocardioides carbamazepini]MCR1782872.1 galactokinase [Nocardioides carbamazepini]
MKSPSAAVVARAPGRVNLIGEHTDYNGGLCLPFAISLTTTATVRRREDDRLRVRSREADPGDPHWQEYVVGVVAELRRAGWVVPGLDIDLVSTLPLGGGLSSSAALECAVATAIAGLLDVPLDGPGRRLLADVCRRAETDHVGAPTGGMDQLAALFGADGHALLIDFADLGAPVTRLVPLPVSEDGLTLLVTDTRVRHQLADGDGGYAQRRRECADGHPRRRRHVATENARVRSAVEAIGARAWQRLGDLMTASHASLRDDYEVSVPALDTAVDAALAAGALGARLTGGGFGGCTIALTHEGRVGAVRNGVDAAFAAAGWPRPAHHEVRPAEGARLL